ncbi:hypothetical protein [Natronomonas gomsonensis]|uniref:DUF7573 domain-containing protein n=1 Tax=Natronomonas gomsonensis TaxID=1046043 RepID=UPI0015BAFD42|nr:hypothetical protein [Natronomonas gomsonensis]
MRDSSLEDFLEGDDSETDAGGDVDDDAANDADTDPDTDASGSVSPAVSTYDWTPTGATCASCDAVVERRWRDGSDDGDGELVCFDCKAW